MCLSWVLVKFCLCPSFPFGVEGGKWDLIVLIADHCLSVYFLSSRCGFRANWYTLWGSNSVINRRKTLVIKMMNVGGRASTICFQSITPQPLEIFKEYLVGL